MLKNRFKKRMDRTLRPAMLPTFVPTTFALLLTVAQLNQVGAQEYFSPTPLPQGTIQPLPQVIQPQDQYQLNPPQVIQPQLDGQAVQPAGVGVPVQPNQRSAAKPVVNAAANNGVTYIALDARLKNVFRGSEPRSVAELKALEEQQSKVASAVEQVTVNVQQGSAQGSGVIITGNGYILTAAHVAGKPGRQAWVRLSDGTRLEATTLGMNRDKDAGLIKILNPPKTPLPCASIGRSSDLRVGQWCIAAGHPGGWQADRGNVIRVGRILSIKGEPAHTLFTDCTLIGGDSGGPLFTLEGKLIGVHSRIGTDVEDNMHVPIEVFEKDWERLAKKEAWGVLPGFRPVIGVKGSDDPAVVEAIVGAVLPDSPAEVAGLIVGDRVVAFDGTKVNTFAELQAAVQQTLPGDTVFIEIIREGNSYRFPIVVGVEE